MIDSTNKTPIPDWARNLAFTPLDGKKPLLKQWQQRAADDPEVVQMLSQPGVNVGVRMGAPSGNLCDVDLDCPEAVRVAKHVLPPTPARFGRLSNPESHWLYWVDHSSKGEAFKGSDGEMLVELRQDGQQTMWIGAIHPSGEEVAWVEDGPPATVLRAELRAAVAKLAAVCEVAQRLPERGRHDVAMALAGALLRSGMPVEDAHHFVELVCIAANDEETADRLRTVEDSANKLERGDPATGWPTLEESLGKPCVDKLRKFLGLKVSAPRHGNQAFEKDEHGMYEVSYDKEGKRYRKQLTNFPARILRQIEIDDGWEKRREFEIEAVVRGVANNVEVAADEFCSMDWVTKLFGAEYVIYPKGKDAARAAIQHFSLGCASDRRYGHTGWRQVNGKWTYLHSGGAVDGDGNHPEVMCALPSSLRPIRLDDSEEHLKDDVKAVLQLSRLEPRNVTLPTLAATVRTVIGHCGLNMLIVGKTGTKKTAVAALFQGFFGSEFSNTRLPGSFQSTPNALEQVANTGKDAVVVIDDFCPNSATFELQRAEPIIDRLFRSNTEGAGRQRSSRDGRLCEGRAPQCTILVTAETLPARSSLRSRGVIQDQGAGVTDLDMLTRCQRDAAEGRYVRGTTAFVRWLAPQLDAVRQLVAEREQELLVQMRSASHGRIPHSAAKLITGMEVFARFLRERGLVTEAEHDELVQGLLREVNRWREDQNELVSESDPIETVSRGVHAALATGKAHFTAKDGGKPGNGPEDWTAYGWKRSCTGLVDSWAPGGTRIGTVEGERLVLFYGAAIEAARSALGPDAAALPDSRRFLQELDRKGLIVERDEQRGENTVRRSIRGERSSGVCILLSTFLGEEPAAGKEVAP